MDANPRSFLHIINAGYGQGKKPAGTGRFQMVRGRFEAFLSQGILIRDQQPCIYLYEQRHETGKYLGFLCATSTEDYRTNIIRRHEDTLEKRERLFSRYLSAVRFNAEPVLMMYPDRSEIAGILEQESRNQPEYDFKTPDGYGHRLWPISDTATLDRLGRLFGEQEALYIADGHHRSASSHLMALEARASNPRHTGREPYNYFMSYLLPESAIRISRYQRLLRDLNGHSRAGFLERLSWHYQWEDMGTIPWRPTEKHHFGMCLGGTFYALKLKEENWRFTDALSRLDTHILYTTLLRPILGIDDLRNDRRIVYTSGDGQLRKMQRKIQRGEFAVGFDMTPVTVAEIKAIADAGQVMPPKSTYIEPKLRSGLTIYEF